MEVIGHGKALIDAWVTSKENTKSASSLLNSRECAEANARNELGKWLMPDDAKPGEKFSVWYGDSLIEVTVTNGDPDIRIRTRGKSLR